ncbi:wax synthase family protein [Aspergillus thermomutatus]|uniref:Wax synthase domain-containing protein n=1 Tax=Aspergillus thermomutatus TaxID=41047 RepID=A0A397FX26_ASPTH|nr:uncharacterized protein CDV56_100199 [Aspergillus thermomutatus]RHZ43225.1 hypothetical protein CDV56_100199 [Aspergillus thermomutatus]
MDPNSLSAWSIPLAQWLLVQLLTGWTIAFTPPSSKIRPAVTVIVIALAYSFQSQVRQTFAETRARGPLAAMCWVNVLNAIDLLMLSRVSFDEQIAWESKKPNQKRTVDRNSYLRRLVWSVEMAFNYRRVNTPWQIRAVPEFDRHEPGFVPTKWDFLRRCAVKVCGSLLVLHFCTIDAGDAHLAGVVSEISETKKVLLPTWEEWTARRVLIQMLFTISFGFVTRAAILGMYNLLAMLFVALGAYEPVDWPPIFGSLGDMYSLTRVWGIAWHQILRKLVTSNADFMLFGVLRLPQGIVAKYLRLIMAFVTSGLVHFLMDLGFGVSLDQSGALWFFCLQIPGIVLENLVWYTCHGMIKQVDYRWRRVLGYAWPSVVTQTASITFYAACTDNYKTKMLLPAIVPLVLLGTAFVFAVIELGLGGHLASFYTGSRKVAVYDPASTWGYSYKTVSSSVPGILAFLLFTAVWTLLVCAAAALLPWFYRAKAAAGSRLNTILTGVLVGVYFVTMVFWLACFADIAAELGGWSYSDYYNAVIAFAVLLWLLFLALFIVVILAVCGVLESDVPGYRVVTRKESAAPVATEGTQMQTVEVA